MKPEERALNYLISRRWYFDDYKQSANQLRQAFDQKGTDNKDCLVSAICYLILKKKDWDFYCLNDIKNLDKARRIYQKYKYD